MNNRIVLILLMLTIVPGLGCHKSIKPTPSGLAIFVGDGADSGGNVLRIVDGESARISCSGTPASQSGSGRLLVVDGAKASVVNFDGVVEKEHDLSRPFSKMVPPDDPKVLGADRNFKHLFYIVSRREPTDHIPNSSGMEYSEWALFRFNTATEVSEALVSLPDLLEASVSDMGLPYSDYSSTNIVAAGDWVYFSVPSSSIVTTSGYSRPLTLRLNIDDARLERIGFGAVEAVFEDAVLLTEEQFDAEGGAVARILQADGREISLGRVVRVCASHDHIGLLPIDSEYLEIRRVSDPLNTVSKIKIPRYPVFGRGLALVTR